MSLQGFYLMPHPPIVIPEVGKGEEKRLLVLVVVCIP
ncbi:hypothetical protein CcarbDRAFT_4426 [Clostridium carboxidivorans P7]|uniref:Uncharacterized protein n=1 Tax=Clostridium carboxidivorans P7 TaxID=536227 RepID=C6Q059_9CLOT|nr:hypothetical protein CcarbDRAFT_4426 [Clostridium carboxidivorans P7]